jgi:transposase-like protein
MSILSKPHFHDETAAYAYLESVLWPNGPICPHCGGSERIYELKGKSTRIGVRKCGHCRKPFRVTVGTVFESSHLPLHKWLQGVYLMSCSKKGVSAHQLHRILEITYKSAWFMAHRIREAMRDGSLSPLGDNGGTVEVDETFIGHDRAIKPKGVKKGRGYAHKHKVLTLIERGGRARSMVVDSLGAKEIVPIVREQVEREARVITDEAGQYGKLGRDFTEHHVVRHKAGEWGRGEIHTNTIEGFFSIFKRGMKGVYQHCAKRHLPRYLAEFDFRYNHHAALGVEDEGRARKALAGARGKRLTYQQPVDG